MRRLWLMMGLSLIACGGGSNPVAPPPPPPPAAVATVVVTAANASLQPPQTTTLTATLKDADGTVLTGRSLTWSSSAEGVASVAAGGLVTAVSAGTAVMTATSEGKSGSVQITVSAVPVATSVVVTPATPTVISRATQAMTAAIRDQLGNPVSGTVTWQSADPAVATVNTTSGLVTAVSPGTTTITAASGALTGTTLLTVVPASLTAIVETYRAQFGLPALGAAIVTRTGKTIAIGVSGNRRWGTVTPVTLTDKWHLGSDTKAMTSFLAAMTVKAGLVSWTDLMVQRYPELAPIARPEFAGATLRTLATMQSGITGNPNFTPVGTLAQQRVAVDNWAVQQAPAATPGTYYYSNVSYQIFAEIIGRAWATGYEQAMRDKLWTPLGITTGGFGPTTGAGQSDQPVGHEPAGGGWTPCEACDNSWAAGSGKIHMSLPDWSRFIWEVLRADVGQSSLLSQSEARLLTTGATTVNANLGYAYGWTSWNNQRTIQHDGTNGRNRARALLYLDAGVAYILTTNAGDSADDGGAPNAAFNALVTRLQTFYQTGQ